MTNKHPLLGHRLVSVPKNCCPNPHTPSLFILMFYICIYIVPWRAEEQYFRHRYRYKTSVQNLTVFYCISGLFFQTVKLERKSRGRREEEKEEQKERRKIKDKDKEKKAEFSKRGKFWIDGICFCYNNLSYIRSVFITKLCD